MSEQKNEKDPQKDSDNVRKKPLTGVMGGLTKAFLGKDFVDTMNDVPNQAAERDPQKALDNTRKNLNTGYMGGLTNAPWGKTT